MKKFKDVELNHLPPHVAEALRTLIPGDADVEFDFSDPFVGVLSAVINDPVKDSCSGMDCSNCDDCPTTAYTDRVDAHSNVCDYLNNLYAAKNADYGNAFGDTFAELGIVSAVTRITDKVNRLKALCKPGSKVRVTDESIRDTLLDLANYAIMTVVELDAKERGAKK